MPSGVRPSANAGTSVPSADTYPNPNYTDFGFVETTKLCPSTTTSNLSPAFTPSFFRNSRGITIRYFEEIVIAFIPPFYQNATQVLATLAATFHNQQLIFGRVPGAGCRTLCLLRVRIFHRVLA